MDDYTQGSMLRIPHYTWCTDWIQEYESIWGIINKFCFVNQLRLSRFHQLFIRKKPDELLNKVLGIDVKKYVETQKN
ncbi:hypothetical protein [Lactiplantibacillus carotarum]|uniref:hypothetical protein n=1 Tax=Lactiplantibacillus carotarum TaxID=2993456 RepID=UPI00298F0325|nr:hypothetical protein [Lactiplantibacillus carotarum]